MWGRQEDNVWYDGAILEWQGRQLQSFQAFSEYDGTNMDDDYAVYFKYNSDGIRTEKITDAGNHEYILNGSQIVGEWIGTRSKLIVYLYDENGTPIGMKIRTNTQAEGEFDEYFFEKNLQGDIVAVYSYDGTLLISYKYDAWGKTTITYSNSGDSTTAVNNSITYRGYYYDKDLGLYYLQSRYYDPVVKRFINADGYISTGSGLLGYNMFAYCNNNPVNLLDPTGDFPWLAVIAVVAVTLIALTSCNAEEDEGQSDNPAPEPEQSITDNINMYVQGDGNDIEGKINVVFMPNNMTDGKPNPNIQIKNATDLSRTEIKTVLEYVTTSEYYDKSIYNRTVESMLKEWDAHNAAYFMTKNERFRDVDFDKNSEEKGYYDYLNEYLGGN